MVKQNSLLYTHIFIFYSTLSKYVNKHQNDWDLYLDHALFALRSKPHTTTKVSPFKLMYGPEARFPVEVAEDLLDFTLPTESDYVEIMDEMESKRAELQIQTKINIDIAQEKQKEKYEKRVSKRYKPCTFAKGQLVLLKNSRRTTRKGGVLEPKFTGPYIITEINEKRVKLANASNVPLARTFNIDMLRTYKSSTVINTPEESVSIRESTASVTDESPSVDMPDICCTYQDTTLQSH
ncbi:hypothetical protein NDU88_007973 [Pleurodeles waltl]|uniref:Uncharacterized protein n=1 Tax=Pleurodeles waltl TaxID=8319 RepID=A0AAV7VU54_PLEWA|nr:hypothetical protein NDU88_007973 [Pleurodeles waltl]